MKRFIFVQIGARHDYSTADVLEQAGILEVFYTDICASTGIGSVLNQVCPQGLRQGRLRGLLNRRVPQILEGKVIAFDATAFRYWVRQKLAGHNSAKQHQAIETFQQEFSKAAIRRGLGQATHIFSMFGEGIDFLEFAKKQNLKIITDIYISPATHRIVQTEREKFPDLEPTLSQDVIQKDYDWFNRVIKVTDIFLAPSNFVRSGLEEFKVKSSKCHVIPYGVGDSWIQLENQPIKGRVLFVGTAELRKGIHILGMAAQKLSKNGYQFRVAGDVSSAIRQHSLTQNLTFLGRIPRDQIQQEYLLADIFVLPSLAEGSAGVTYEALAVGLPVITTEAAGSVVRDGIEGFIIPERDPVALAIRIHELIANRELRDHMAVAAKERAKNFTWNHYKERLLKLIETI